MDMCKTFQSLPFHCIDLPAVFRNRSHYVIGAIYQLKQAPGDMTLQGTVIAETIKLEHSLPVKYPAHIWQGFLQRSCSGTHLKRMWFIDHAYSE